MRDKKGEKRKSSLIRFYISALFFLIGTTIIVSIFVLPFFLFGTWWITLIYTVVVYLLNAVLALFIFNSKSQINFKTSWLVVICVLPFAGALLYLMFANKITTKKRRKLRFNKIRMGLWAGKEDSENELNRLRQINPDQWAIATYLYKSCQASLYSKNESTYFRLGEHAYPSILQELEKARRFIYIEYFLIEDGYMFGKIYQILKRKAAIGVDVRLLYDDFGSVGRVEANFFEEARKDKMKCFTFNRMRPAVDIRQNSRDHRKIIVIDGIVGFTGGCNLADEYINKKKRFGIWKDNFVMVKGPAVSGLTTLFLSNWAMIDKDADFDSNEIKNHSYTKNLDLVQKRLNVESDSFVQSFGEVPFDGEDGAKTVILQMILRAKKNIYISTPYLNPSEEIITALQTAAKSGIDVRIITPGIPDKRVTYFLTRSYYGNLLDEGVKIYEYLPGFNHCKIILVDDETAMTGTINLDYRSLYLHFENGIMFYGGATIKEIKKDFEEMLSVSKLQYVSEWINKPKFTRILWAILKIISPLF